MHYTGVSGLPALRHYIDARYSNGTKSISLVIAMPLLADADIISLLPAQHAAFSRESSARRAFGWFHGHNTGFRMSRRKYRLKAVNKILFGLDELSFIIVELIY